MGKKSSLRNNLIRLSNRIFGKDLSHRFPPLQWSLTLLTKVRSMVSPAYRRQSAFERDHPDAPWFVPEAVFELEKILKTDWRGFEWGSGRSSVWFGKRVAHISSIEGREQWMDSVRTQIAEAGLED